MAIPPSELAYVALENRDEGPRGLRDVVKRCHDRGMPVARAIHEGMTYCMQNDVPFCSPIAIEKYARAYYSMQAEESRHLLAIAEAI